MAWGLGFSVQGAAASRGFSWCLGCIPALCVCVCVCVCLCVYLCACVCLCWVNAFVFVSERACKHACL